MERRRYSRYETKIGATIVTTDTKIEVCMTDISEGGIGVISEKVIEPGAKVLITLELKDKYIIQGIVVWSSYIYDKGENYYKMGIETESIILSDIKAIGFPGRSELVTKIFSEIKKKGVKIIKK